MVTSEDVASLKTFSAMAKEAALLTVGEEVEIFRCAGRGCLTHMWFAMDERVRVRVYVDGETTPSIDMALDLGHGYAFGGPRVPFGSPVMGRYGAQFNTYRIPYGDGVRVTLFPAAEDLDRGMGRTVWWIIRGTENLPPVVGGVPLPDSARLRLHVLEDHVAAPLDEFVLCDVKGAGALFQVTMAAQGLRESGTEFANLGYMEGCLRAYLEGQDVPEYLSSGLEDYFLGSGYFHQNQLYFGAAAGLTFLDKSTSRFSAYRLHDDDPVFFQNGLRLTLRNGEELNGAVLHDPPPARYSTYVWVYEW